LRTGGTQGAVSVNYNTIDKTALAGQAYDAISGTLQFAAGETLKSVYVNIIDNTIFAANKIFSLELSNPQGGALLAQASTEVTITDNEPIPVAGAFVIAASNLIIDEDGQPITITVNRVGGSQGSASVIVTTQTSMTGTEAAQLVLGIINQELTFADGETQKTLVVTPEDNSAFQGDVRVKFLLTSPVNAVIGNTASVTLQLQDDDSAPPQGVFSFSGDNYVFNEAALTFPVTIVRTQGSSGPASVDLVTTNGTALSGTDFVPENTTVVFADGELSKTISLVVNNDNIYRGKRSFSVSLSKPEGGAFLANDNLTASVVLEENDPAPSSGVLQFSSSTYTVNENESSIILTVSRMGGSFGSASVDYQVASSSSATLDSDYRLTNGTLYFADGETTKTFSLSILDDTANEPAETVVINLLNATNAGLAASNTTQVTIVDNDPLPEKPKSKSGGGSTSLLILLMSLFSFVILFLRNNFKSRVQ
jgi:hypothetical protein